MKYVLQTAMVWYQCCRQGVRGCGIKYVLHQTAMVWYQCCRQGVRGRGLKYVLQTAMVWHQLTGCERLCYEVRFSAHPFDLVLVLWTGCERPCHELRFAADRYGLVSELWTV